MDQVTLLAKHMRGKGIEGCPLLVVEVEVGAGHFRGPLAETDFVRELAYHGAVGLTDFAEPQTSPRDVPVNDLLSAHNAFGEAGQQKPPLALDDCVLQ